MAEGSIRVFAVYPHRSSCEYAVSALKVAGFRDKGVSIPTFKRIRG